MRIRKSYGLQVEGEFFVNVNVNVKVNVYFWKMEDRRWEMGEFKDPADREGRL